LVLAVFVNLIGGLGPLNPSRILWTALGMDLVGVALLGWIFWDSAGPIEGRMRIVRRIAALLLFLWVGLTAFWRFVLPAAAGTDMQALFSAFLIGPADSRRGSARTSPACTKSSDCGSPPRPC